MLCSADTIESFVRSALPTRTHDNFLVTAVGYNRPQPNGTKEKYANRNEPKVRFPVSSIGWRGLIDQWRHSLNLEEAGIEAKITDDYQEESLYLPLLDFNPEMSKGTREETSFWEDMEQTYTGKKMYLFNSGSAKHGLLTSLQDHMTSALWLQNAKNYPHIIDQKWVSYAFSSEGHGILRVTAGKTRPLPSLHRWVNL